MHSSWSWRTRRTRARTPALLFLLPSCASLFLSNVKEVSKCLLGARCRAGNIRDTSCFTSRRWRVARISSNATSSGRRALDIWAGRRRAMEARRSCGPSIFRPVRFDGRRRKPVPRCRAELHAKGPPSPGSAVMSQYSSACPKRPSTRPSDRRGGRR